jgi:ribosomal protein S18 acetylase RimI-like enzyme
LKYLFSITNIYGNADSFFSDLTGFKNLSGLKKKNITMKIKNLESVQLSEIVDCMLIAFEGYFVQMPSDLEYWANRYRGARVDFSLSYGMFDEGKLVGFIINGVDWQDGHLTAFNTGTGVIPSHRGLKVVDQLYEFAFPEMKEKSVTKCALEVIQDNSRAIRVYERIGFSIEKDLRCFRGNWNVSGGNTIIESVNFDEVTAKNSDFQRFYSWDNINQAIAINPSIFEHFFIKNNQNELLGYCSLQPKTNSIAQIEIFENEPKNWQKLFETIQKIAPSVRIINVNGERKTFISEILKAGLENHIDQFEMVKWI